MHTRRCVNGDGEIGVLRMSIRARSQPLPRCSMRAGHDFVSSIARMPRLAVLGQPVAHSRSPAMQSAALVELGLAPRWSFEAIEVAPDGFEALVRKLPGDDFVGVNVTVPHKRAALALADTASDVARAIG